MSNKDSFFALLTGVIIGAAAGVLFAPQSGKETREDLKKLGLDLKEKSKDIIEDGKSFVAEGKTKVKDIIEDGKSFVEEGKTKVADVIEKKKNEYFGSKEK